MNVRNHHGRSWFLATLLTVSLGAAACGGGETAPGSGDTAAPTAGETGDPEGDATAGEGDLVSDAQEEGEVVLYAGGHTRPGAELLKERFEEKYGITVTFVRDDSGAVVQMVESELAGGNLNADVVSLTDAPSLFRWAEEGVTTSVDIPNQDQILDGLQSPGAPHVPYSLVPLGIMYNGATMDDTDLPGTWEELASSYSGKIVMANPSASGTALMFFSMMVDEMGDDWLAQLAERDVIVTDSSLALAQLVVTGEADLGIPAIESAVISAAEGGEPIEITFPDEGVPSFASSLAALAEAPHPAAAELLVQYHLSEEFQAALTELGARSVLEGGPQPTQGADLSDANILSPDYAALADEAEALRARFDELFGS